MPRLLRSEHKHDDFVAEMKIFDLHKRKEANGNRYYIYLIRVHWKQGNEYVIYRRFSEFLELHEALESRFKTSEVFSTQMPPLPEKVFVGLKRSATRGVAEGRVPALQKYLDTLLGLPAIYAQSGPVDAFACLLDSDTADGREDSEDSSEEMPHRGAHVRALYSYEGGSNPNDLVFEEGAIIALIRHVSEDWLEGELGGVLGLMPRNYVEIIEDVVVSSPPSRPQPPSIKPRKSSEPLINTSKPEAPKMGLSHHTSVSGFDKMKAELASRPMLLPKPSSRSSLDNNSSTATPQTLQMSSASPQSPPWLSDLKKSSITPLNVSNPSPPKPFVPLKPVVAAKPSSSFGENKQSAEFVCTYLGKVYRKTLESGNQSKDVLIAPRLDAVLACVADLIHDRTFTLNYLDQDGDCILISDQADLDLMVKSMQGRKVEFVAGRKGDFSLYAKQIADN